ncbi:acyltransferase family protein [Fulvivirga sedimenti]|uniref:Acyltransferase family protein n=1 Tax=Fulvivirga sedimenti TaxID=2879465 RepID=A0A9X1HW29_9BACT|nr:acyltransferase family protein [Fulvivirga sedimenti]MCA6078921.1 acyltransferase family protein [Fulvivirga sedimenti]
MTSQRRFDIDWLRVIAIGLLLIYHITIGFQPWGIFIGFIQNDQPLESLWIPMSMLNVWRIPLLFFVSGMGVSFAIRRRGWKELIMERSRRILVPFLFGMAAIVPLHILIWQDYYHQDLKYIFHPSHLWFLGNIFVYVMVLSPVFFYLKNHRNGAFERGLNKLLKNPLGLLVIMVPFILEAELIRPESFELYALTLHGWVLGAIAFFTGYCVVYSGLAFWNTVTTWRWVLLGLALTFYLVRVIVFELRSPDFMMSVESNLWIFTVFGFGHRHLNKPGKALQYLSEAAYPVYIIHMFFLYLGSSILFTLGIPASVKFILLNLFVLTGCFLLYEFVIRRVRFLRPLFGLKNKKLGSSHQNTVVIAES